MYFCARIDGCKAGSEWTLMREIVFSGSVWVQTIWIVSERTCTHTHTHTQIALNKCPPSGGRLPWRLIQVRVMRAGHLLAPPPLVPADLCSDTQAAGGKTERNAGGLLCFLHLLSTVGVEKQSEYWIVMTGAQIQTLQLAGTSSTRCTFHVFYLSNSKNCMLL